MKFTKSIAILSLAVLSLSIAQPISAFAETNSEASQTATAISNATSNDNVQVNDLQVGKSATTDEKDLQVTLPKDADDDIKLTNSEDSTNNIQVSLPDEFSSKATAVGDTAVYTGDDSSSNLGLQNTDNGFRALISINSADASHDYSFDLDLPDGYKLIDASSIENKSPGTGDIYVLNEDDLPVNELQAPWAKDINGNAVPTHYVINGHTVTQVIDFDEKNFVPLVADPNLRFLGKHWYNKTTNIAKAIDLGILAWQVYSGARGAVMVAQIIRKNRTAITRIVEKQILKIVGPNLAGLVLNAVNAAAIVGGFSIGSAIAGELDRLDGCRNGYIGG
ncbi:MULTISPECIES: hypothetical protein [unclassified Lactococcus]|uniref:hypothetical protein n=1 Tax=unclassified Lactococcus TaxID=2643510 RepID=UPI0011C7AF52|nr:MULTISPECIES: hypothetical protein [unclassified Lactococcus]MQW22699.1 hypothetical protein [Lactococcus sp. dk101]TXK44706.1 hypothetical protein FVP42_03650 [Lactococcus sp. dk310]TXK50600.1 hypothetical protein FVP43_03650 [Lactococcus sp. dk322]